MSNRLAGETSPYLLQHKDNPVDWYPWGDEAFERAKQEDKPIFLSVGYSACHWCHVMAHESFEDLDVAALMNEHFVNIKVDREERPDVDSIYMNAVQAMTGQGGWPMSVWMMPDGRPFYGGTYFPKNARYGMPGFIDVLKRVSNVYHEKREALDKDATNLTRAINRSINLSGSQESELSKQTLELAFQKIAATYDEEWGGFGERPKFPPSMTLELLFRLYHDFGWQHALDMATNTLDRMMWGGMYDQLGGGFHRYSTDHMWLVPHFEKMLYDNALLIRAYLYGYQITRSDSYLRVVEQTIEYVRREMTSPEGGFYSAQDADSEGEEGKYFVWTQEELRSLLSSIEHVDAVLDYWGVRAGPNFEGKNILWIPVPADVVAIQHYIEVATLIAEVERSCSILFDSREKRVKPGRDEKILTAWNGMMIKSLAEAGRSLNRYEYTETAVRAAHFVLGKMRGNGRLLRSYKDGQAKINGFLEDYASLGEALIELYQTTFDVRWYDEAEALTETMVDLFWDDEGGFYDTARDQEGLITRPQEITDNAIPSGTSSAVELLLRMAIYAGRDDWRERAEWMIKSVQPAIQQYPSAFSYLASQLAFQLSSPHEVALVGDVASKEMRALFDVLFEPFRPDQIVALRHPSDGASAEKIPLLTEREMIGGKATAYVCHHYVCKLPVTEPEGLGEQLNRTSLD